MPADDTKNKMTGTAGTTDEGTAAAPAKAVSPRKLEANRQNAKLSTGPKTPEGKATSSRNAITHGIFAKQFFAGAAPETLKEMQELAAGIWAHYQPMGTIEELLAEKLCIEAARYGRVLKIELHELARKDAFFSLAVDRVGRYGAGVNRELYRVMDQLERIQTERKARPNSADSADSAPERPSVEGDDAPPADAS